MSFSHKIGLSPVFRNRVDKSCAFVRNSKSRLTITITNNKNIRISILLINNIFEKTVRLRFANIFVHIQEMQSESQKYAHVYPRASQVRRKYGLAKQDTCQNVQNSAWIMSHLESLAPPDIALLAEYNRDSNVRKLLVNKLDVIPL